MSNAPPMPLSSAMPFEMGKGYNEEKLRREQCHEAFEISSENNYDIWLYCIRQRWNYWFIDTALLKY